MSFNIRSNDFEIFDKPYFLVNLGVFYIKVQSAARSRLFWHSSARRSQVHEQNLRHQNRNHTFNLDLRRQGF